ncbi:MAG: PDZ domain-containing protein [Chitinophagaceae bacterium]|nr:PDZ domain-containing protein [Chitinophagaceae bacterium]
MKKITIAMLAFTVLPFIAMAQDGKKERVEKEEIIEKREAPERKERPEKKETQEIIIKQNGDKDIKLKVEIDGDNITVNGQPLSEFKDKNITINKRKMTITDGDHIMNWNFSGDGDGWEKFGETFGESFGEHWNGEDHNSSGAFLGVTTETEGEGVKVVEVVKGSAAEKAGLKKGDIITKVGEEKITSPEILSDVIGFKKPTNEVKITYKRAGKESTVKATLGKRKQTRALAFTAPRGNMRSFTLPPTPPLTNMEGYQDDIIELQENALYHAFPGRKKIGLKIQDTEEGNGVKIINVEDSSAAATAGIKKDDIISEIDGRKVENTDDAREQLAPAEDKKSYKIKINRGGSEMNFDVKIPRKLKTANL